MSLLHHPRRAVAVVAATVSAIALAAPAAASADARDRSAFVVDQVNLVSDLATVGASLVDPDVINPWGLALGPTTPLWSANAGTDTATLYASAPGSTVAAKVTAVRVTFPHVPEIPTGQVFNGTDGFNLSNGTVTSPARFIFSTITGHIEAWSPVVDPLLGNAETKASPPGAVYTGLALATASDGPRLYAANFGQGRVDVFGSDFALRRASQTHFHDRTLPQGYSPFGIAALNNKVFVAYALVDPVTHRNAVGKGLGFVDEYTPNGRLIARIASHRSLNAPWGLEFAPASWGALAGDLLVGNFGDGKINVVAPSGHGDDVMWTLTGQLRNHRTGHTLAIPGLWSLLRGTDTTGGTDSIWFSAGIDNEQHGLIGVLRSPAGG